MKVFEQIELKTFREPPKPAPTYVHSVNDFDGAEFSSDWEVLNSDTNSYTVENDKLLVVNRTEISLDEENVRNLIRPGKPTLEEDWQLAMYVKLDLQTERSLSMVDGPL